MEAGVHHETLASAIDQATKNFLQRINGIWSQMGFSPAQEEERRSTVRSVIESSYNNMVEEEEGHLARMVDTIEKHGKERMKLARELGDEPEDPPEDLKLIQLEMLLRNQVQKLRDKKDERMAEVLALKKEDEAICSRIEQEPHYISSTLIPTSQQMQAIHKHLEEVRSIKASREGSFSEMKSAIVELLEQLDTEPETGFEREVVCEDEDSFCLSAENMAKVQEYLRCLELRVEANKQHAEELRAKIVNLIVKLDLGDHELRQIEILAHSPRDIAQLQSKLKDLEVLKGEKMEVLIIKTREDLIHLWDKTYYSGTQRAKFKPFSSTDWTEEVLQLHEDEVARLSKYHDDHAELFAKVAKRQQLWNKLLEIEASEKDPQRLLKARGNALIREERDRARVKKQLPKVEAELAEAMQLYQNRTGQPFLVGGVCYEEFIRNQVEEHAIAQEEEREAKKAEKKKALVHETIYGSKPVTPAASRTQALKRRAAGVESAASSSKRYRTDATPGSATLMRTQYARNLTAHKVGKQTNVTSSANKSKYGLRNRNGVPRNILGSNNQDDTFIAGYNAKKMDGMSTVDSDRFMTSPIPHGKRTKASTTSTPVFKTPNSRILTPANKSGKKLSALRSGRPLPFYI